MKNVLKKRMKNKAFWISLIALAPLVAKTFGVELVQDEFDQLANALLAVLVAAGIVNNPTAGTGFMDDDTTN